MGAQLVRSPNSQLECAIFKEELLKAGFDLAAAVLFGVVFDPPPPETLVALTNKKKYTQLKLRMAR